MRDVTVVYHEEQDGWWADSPDLGGYAATGGSLAEVRKLVREGLPFFVGDAGIQILERLSDGGIPVEASFEATGPFARISTYVLATVTATVRQPSTTFNQVLTAAN